MSGSDRLNNRQILVRVLRLNHANRGARQWTIVQRRTGRINKKEAMTSIFERIKNKFTRQTIGRHNSVSLNLSIPVML